MTNLDDQTDGTMPKKWHAWEATSDHVERTDVERTYGERLCDAVATANRLGPLYGVDLWRMRVAIDAAHATVAQDAGWITSERGFRYRLTPDAEL